MIIKHNEFQQCTAIEPNDREIDQSSQDEISLGIDFPEDPSCFNTKWRRSIEAFLQYDSPI
jgi:hypothetical protein